MRYGESLNSTLRKILKDVPESFLLGEDIEDPYGGAFLVTKDLSTDFPGRVRNTPIAEASITGMAIGMAMRGMRPIVEIMFGDFLTLCTDQIINGMSKFVELFDMDIPVIIRTPMGGYRGYGPTHSQSIEGMYLNIPNLNVVYSSLYHNPGQLLIEAFNSGKPTLFCENKLLYGRKLKLADEIRSGNAVVFIGPKKEPDVTIITYGYSASMAKNAAIDAFIHHDITSTVVIASTLSPINLNFPTTSKVIIVEEGEGWATRLATNLYEERFQTLSEPVYIIQKEPNRIIPAATEQELQVLPTQNEIYHAICTMMA